VKGFAGSRIILLSGWLLSVLAPLAFSSAHVLSFASSSTDGPRTGTLRGFQSYVLQIEAVSKRSLSSGNFLWVDDLPQKERGEAYAKLRRGEVAIRRVTAADGAPNNDIPGGMIHDWEGIVFIPGANLDEVLKLLQDYDHHATYYAPDVQRAKIESHDGDHFVVFLRFRRQKIVTVVLNTQHDVKYFRDSPARAHSRSSAIRIAEVENPGTPKEKEKPQGEDSGFLWRMETWWRMEQKDGGVYVQNEVVSLTRDIPTGLAWLFEPFITSIPKESLQFTLGATRKAALRQKQD
jgi:hypothetical protein